MRQIHRALRPDTATPTPSRQPLTKGKATIALSAQTDLLGLRPHGGTPLGVSLKLRLADGTTKKFRFARRSRMTEVATLDTWWIDLSGFERDGAKLEIAFRMRDGVRDIEVLTGDGATS